MKEAVLKENCQKLINQIVEDIHTSPQNADKSKFITYDVKGSSIIWNLMKGGYDFSFNQFEFIVENMQMLKTVASNDMWEKYHKKSEEGYTWEQQYKQHFRGDTQMIKPFPDERPRNQNNINKVTGDEMTPAILIPKPVGKKTKPKITDHEDADLFNHPDNQKAVIIEKHLYGAIRRKKKKKKFYN